MASVSDELILKMKAAGARSASRDVRGVSSDVRKMGHSADEASRKNRMLGRSTSLLQKPFHHLRSEVAGAAKGFLAAGIAFGSVEGIKSSIETTDELVKTTVKLHNQFGLTTQSASGLAGVLQARDLAPSSLIMGLTSLSRAMLNAHRGAQAQQLAFRHLGIEAHTIKTGLGSKDGLESVFERVTKRMTEMHGSASKAAIGQALLGRASKGLAPLMQEGALGLEQQLKWAKEYGVTLDGTTIKSVEQMAAAQTQSQYAMLGLQIQIGRFAAPAMTKANKFLADVVRSFREGRPEGSKFAQSVYRVGHALGPLAHVLGVVGSFLSRQPRLLEAAAIGWGLYKLRVMQVQAGLVASSAGEGMLAGRAFMVAMAAGVALYGAHLLQKALSKSISDIANDQFGGAKTREYKTRLPHSARSLGSIQDYIDRHDTPAHRRTVNDWYSKHPGYAKMAHVGHGRDGVLPAAGTAALRRLIRAGDPALVPGAFGVPSNYRPGHAYKGPIKEELVVHLTTNIDGKQAAKQTHRQAIKRKSTR